jgi:lysophospholipase L1-like esterase
VLVSKILPTRVSKSTVKTPRKRKSEDFPRFFCTLSAAPKQFSLPSRAPREQSPRMQRLVRIFLIAGFLISGPLARAATDAFEKWEPEIQKFEAADRAEKPPKGAILFVGSSSIRFWTNLAESFPKKKIIQRGFGGSTMADALHFADRIILPYEPKQIVIYEGDNDIAAGKAPNEITSEFIELAEKIRAKLPKTKIRFISVKPSPSRWKLEGKARQLNAEIEAWTRAHKGVGYIDVWNPMLGPDGKPMPNIFRADNLHMNADGYAIWTKVIGKKL